MSDPAWYENDRFWRVYRDELFPARKLEATGEEVERILELLELEPPAEVVDLCCGPGRHVVELARRGFTVTGVDLSPEYLESARESCREASVDVELVCADMREFVRPRYFDAVINMFTSFGYFEDRADDLRVVQNLHTSLRPGGRVLIDTKGKENLARLFQPRAWHETEDGSIFLEERQLSENFSWIESRWIKIRGTDREEFTISHRLYSAWELEGLLREAGFDTVRIYGSLAGAGYDHEAKRLVAVAEK